jgi:hypothetical protein
VCVCVCVLLIRKQKEMSSPSLSTEKCFLGEYPICTARGKVSCQKLQQAHHAAKRDGRSAIVATAQKLGHVMCDLDLNHHYSTTMGKKASIKKGSKKKVSSKPKPKPKPKPPKPPKPTPKPKPKKVSSKKVSSKKVSSKKVSSKKGSRKNSIAIDAFVDTFKGNQGTLR